MITPSAGSALIGNSPAAPYMFDNRNSEAGLQLKLLGETLDEHSISVLMRIGVEPGQLCLDLGSGAGTIPLWLAGRGARVVAVDRDPRHIPIRDMVEVRATDVWSDDFGSEVFDLIHARLLFMHLRQPEALIRRLLGALRPGGRLVLSDWDCRRVDEMLIDPEADVASAFSAYQAALIAIGEGNGGSASWAVRAPAAMLAAGLTDVSAEVYNKMWRGGEPGCLLHASNSRQLETPLLAGGVTPQQLAIVRTAMEDDRTRAWSYPMVTTVGRRTDT